MNKFVEIDFEFFDSSERDPVVVCCSLREVVKIGKDNIGKYQVHEYWTIGDNDKTACLVGRLLKLREEGAIFLAFGAGAEARCFWALGLNPLEFNWICEHAEWKCITNHYSTLRYGKHYIDGKVKTLIPPKWEKWGENESNQKLKHSLTEMVFKLHGEKIDTDHKNEMRDIIISGDLELIENNREAIQTYCTSDIVWLHDSLEVLLDHYKRLFKGHSDLKKLIKQDMFKRGETMVRTARIEREGYYINYEATKNFSEQCHEILKEVQRDINEQFPKIGVFKLDKKTRFYTKKEKPIKEWISKLNVAEQWPLTDKGSYSLAQDSFSKFFNYKHSYPRNNFGAQMLRYLKLKQSLSGFMPVKNPTKKGQNKFWDSVGRDGIVRPYLNAYGSQAGRFQPAATGFLFLKPAWMRSLAQPPKGKVIAGIDYKSQEYLISALMSGDKAMLEAYRSGDVYLAYAKDTGMAPQSATKKTHPEIRDMCKPVILGITYDMSKYGLAIDMTEKLGREVSTDEAQQYINSFYAQYYKFGAFKEEIQQKYTREGFLRIPDGWYMWGDNPNFRSVGNCPIQGAGGAILRKAIELLQDRGIEVCVPLHDALYVTLDNDEILKENLDTFAECMIEAFDFYFPGSGVIIDCEVWGPELSSGTLTTPKGVNFATEEIHIDERAGDEYERFKEFFDVPGEKLL